LQGFDSTKIPKHFEMGTLIEGTGEFYCGRMTKKERKQSFTEEILHDIQVKKERKRRYDKMQEEKQELARKQKKIRAHHKRSAHRPKH
jgi:Fcf2 pre-rRNA processing